MEFLARALTRENYWRSVILFGANVASYKFALGKSLLELGDRRNDLVSLEELAAPFGRHICNHMARNPKQSTSVSSKFLRACRAFNEEEITEGALISTTVKLGFVDVIDAFHVVNRGEIDCRFFVDERTTNGGIRITEELLSLIDDGQSVDLALEVEARWRLVETAWELGVSRNLVALGYDAGTKGLVARMGSRRIDVTSSRDALNGYQKGKCFHCFSDVSLKANEDQLADVDHFFPHSLVSTLPEFPVDGIWNLVLACQRCNRGEDGKFAKVPSLSLLSRLAQRNEFLISSHHPLRETLIQQTGKTPIARSSFLQSRYDEARAILLHTWEPEFCEKEAF